MRRVMVVAAAGGRDTTCLEPLCMLFMGHHARSHTATPGDDGSPTPTPGRTEARDATHLESFRFVFFYHFIFSLLMHFQEWATTTNGDDRE